MTHKTHVQLNVSESDGYMWDYLTVTLESKSLDLALSHIETLPEVKTFLQDSTIGLEYLDIQFNHGCDVIVKIPRYSK